MRSAPIAPIQSPPSAMPASAISTMPRAEGIPTTAAPITAAAKPPSTIAPSPPITTSPKRAGSATHSAARIKGATRDSVFCHEKAEENPAFQTSVKNSTGDLPTSNRNRLNTTKPTHKAPSGIATASARGIRTAIVCATKDRDGGEVCSMLVI